MLLLFYNCHCGVLLYVQNDNNSALLPQTCLMFVSTKNETSHEPMWNIESVFYSIIKYSKTEMLLLILFVFISKCETILNFSVYIR